MDITGKRPLFFSRPADKSLQAFKDWFRDVCAQLQATGSVSDAEVEAAWREFWDTGAPEQKKQVHD